MNLLVMFAITVGLAMLWLAQWGLRWRNQYRDLRAHYESHVAAGIRKFVNRLSEDSIDHQRISCAHLVGVAAEKGRM